MDAEFVAVRDDAAIETEPTGKAAVEGERGRDLKPDRGCGMGASLKLGQGCISSQNAAPHPLPPHEREKEFPKKY